MFAGFAAQSMTHSASFGTSAGATSLDVGTDAKLMGAFSDASTFMQVPMSRAARTLTPAQEVSIYNKMGL